MAHGHQQRGPITKYIYHAYEGGEVERDGFLTILMDDKVFQIEPHNPFEMTADSNGRILDHPDFYLHMILQTYGHIYGIVQVETHRERTGLVMDTDQAEHDSQKLLEKNRWEHVNAWVMTQLNERIKEGKPVLPPTGFVEESIKHLNIDLPSRYKIQPVGWDWKPDTSRKVLGSDPKSLGFLGSGDSAAENAILREENAALNARLDRLERMLSSLVAQEPEDTGVQGESPEEEAPQVQEGVVLGRPSGRRRG